MIANWIAKGVSRLARRLSLTPEVWAKHKEYKVLHAQFMEKHARFMEIAQLRTPINRAKAGELNAWNTATQKLLVAFSTNPQDADTLSELRAEIARLNDEIFPRYEQLLSPLEEEQRRIEREMHEIEQRQRELKGAS